MGNYGFDDDDEGVLKKAPLPRIDKKKSNKDVAKATTVGNELGFVSRKAVGSQPRRRAVEKQSKLLLTGPERILGEIRQMADERKEPYWRVLEYLLGRDSQ